MRSRTALNPFLTYPVYDFSTRQFLEGLRACSDRAWRPHNLEPLKRTHCGTLTPAEKAFIAAIRSLLANGSPGGVDAAAKRFLEAAPTPKAARRRAHALLRLAGEHYQ